MTPEPEITNGELYRICKEIKGTLAQMQDDAKTERHDMRDRINAQGLQLAVLQHEVEDVKAQVSEVKDKQTGTRNWVAGVISGGVVGGLILFVQWLIQRGTVGP